MSAQISLVKQDFSEAWMKENPALAGEAVARFFREYPPEQWRLTIRRAVMPGMWLTLSASRKP